MSAHTTDCKAITIALCSQKFRAILFRGSHILELYREPQAVGLWRARNKEVVAAITSRDLVSVDIVEDSGAM